VFGERELVGRPFPQNRRQFFAERGVHLFENGTRRRKSIRQRLAHADCLTALPWKNESRRHSALELISPGETPRAAAMSSGSAGASIRKSNGRPEGRPFIPPARSNLRSIC